MKKEEMTGRIEMIIGPMFSSKSSSLISRIERLLIGKKTVLALKWKGDTRYTEEEKIMTHSKLSCPCICCDVLENIFEEAMKYEYVCIDEGAFFKDIVVFCEKLANSGKVVIVATLIGTYQREGFNDILSLVPKCEEITMLHAICMRCHNDGASFTKRIVSGNETEMVGGSDKYIACCRNCFFLKEEA